MCAILFHTTITLFIYDLIFTFTIKPMPFVVRAKTTSIMGTFHQVKCSEEEEGGNGEKGGDLDTTPSILGRDPP